MGRSEWPAARTIVSPALLRPGWHRPLPQDSRASEAQHRGEGLKGPHPLLPATVLLLSQYILGDRLSTDHPRSAGTNLPHGGPSGQVVSPIFLSPPQGA